MITIMIFIIVIIILIANIVIIKKSIILRQIEMVEMLGFLAQFSSKMSMETRITVVSAYC